MILIADILPKTQSRLLQTTLVLLTTVWVSVGGFAIVSGGLRPSVLSVGIALIAIGVFLWRMSPIACGITKFMIGLLVVVSIVSIVGPCLETACSYGDFVKTGWGTLVTYFLFLLWAFFSFWILDRHKEEFDSPRQNETEGNTR